MAPRSYPASRVDAIYERVIEIQERQQAFNDELLRGGMQRDKMLESMESTQLRIARLLEERGPIFEQIIENTDDGKRDAIIDAVVRSLSDRFDTSMTRSDRSFRRFSMIFIIAVFIGQVVGVPVGQWFSTLIQAAGH